MVTISYSPSRSILSRATGYISAFDYTLNPYKGCQFGCGYCYAAFFADSLARKETWGQWLVVKENAVELLRRRGGRIAGKSIYMSSVTDPYQPVERRLRLTRELLEVMLPHQPRLVIQTRGPLVTRTSTCCASSSTCASICRSRRTTTPSASRSSRSAPASTGGSRPSRR
jgi:DNA repair photolyase